MKKLISEPEFDNCFDEVWSTCENEFFKCETLPFYSEEGEHELLDLFQRGRIKQLEKALRTDVEQEDSIWQEAKQRGIRFIRVHVYVLPLHDYIKFELVAYKIQAEAHEEILMVPWNVLDLHQNEHLQDFMLFDRQRGLIVTHNKNGEILHARLTDEPSEIQRLCQLRQHFLQIGTPLSEFLYRYEHDISFESDDSDDNEAAT